MGQASNGGKILMIGATGNVGSFVTPALLKQGEGVRCMVRDEAKAAPLKEAGAEIVLGDLDDQSSLERAMNGIDTVFLVIANSQHIEQQGRNAIAAAVNAGVRRLIRYSAIKTGFDANLRSQGMQARVDEVLESSGLEYSHVRPTNYMQVYLMAAPTVQSDSAMYFPFGDGRIGMADVRDIAEAAVEVITGEGHEGKSYSVTGPEALNLHEVAEAISGAIGKKVSYVDTPEEATRDGLLSSGMDAWLVDEYMAFFKLFKLGHGEIVTDDFEKLTGHKPRTIHDFARDYASAFNPELATAEASTN